MATHADRSKSREPERNNVTRRERNIRRFSIALLGSVVFIIGVILVLSFLLGGAGAPFVAAAAIPALILGYVMVRVAWAASAGQLDTNDRMALIGGAVVALLALAVGIWVEPWLGAVIAVGGLLFVGTMYGLNRAQSNEPAEGGPEQPA